MKKLILFVAAMIVSAAVMAQVPQGFSYQAVVRDNANAVVSNANIDVTISILSGASADNAMAVYSEKHSVTTNANGLFTLVVGQGKSSQSFASIDWSNGTYFVKTESSYGTSTTQLLSVPYAMYAAKAGNSDIDLSGYALKSDIPAALDMSEYAKKTDVVSATDVAATYLSKEAFEAYVLSGGKTESVDLTVFAKTEDVAATYAKKTDIPSLEGYAKISDIPAALDLSEYAKKTDVVSATDVAAAYLSKEVFETYVLSGGKTESVDLTVYAKT